VAEDSGPLIETRGLTKVFRDFWGRPRVRAVDGLDLAVGRGEIFGLLGPNGSGKSTTIKLLVGLLHATAGEARVLGAHPRDVASKARLGFLPEESPFHPHLTAEETLRFHASLFSIARRDARRRTDRLLERMGLSPDRSRRVGEFSKGMLRRLGMALALLNEPALLILDEPTSGLDPLGTRDFKDLLAELRKEGRTVLLSSHLLGDAEEVCDRVAILHRGKLAALGPVPTLLEDDRRTRIITERLDPATIEALIALLRERMGPDVRVDVGTPSARLEAFFLRTVGRAGRDAPP
jgi:ABC-2 type transport system ATP-binding protein